MAISAKHIRAQLSLLKPLLTSCSLQTLRKAQNKVGELMERRVNDHVVIKHHPFADFTGAWAVPRDERREGVILYLHGGGYVCGDLEYALGFGSVLAVQTGTKVFCAAYRLAPEHPFPAALDDAVAAYQYLLSKGYRPDHIALCGESAGGGLCYSLCIRCKQLGLPLPGSILAMSPWTDLTASGQSYQENKDRDPSMCIGVLDFFADHYTKNRTNPLVSPLFADLEGMPPSLIFAGGDEIMRSDAELIDSALKKSGNSSQLVVKPERWHGYLLYNLWEDQDDFIRINHFLNTHLAQAHKLRWLKLDNAAKIYPAARRENWSNVYRLSATLTEDVDKTILQSALDVTVRRFPSIAARLRRGIFWYYLQQLEHAPEICEEYSHPLTRMNRDEIRRCAFRVIAYKNRIAVEFFHSLTDGNGGLVFLKSLVAEYLQQRYGVHIPAENGVLGRLEEPDDAELEDSFLKYAGPVNASRKENDAWHVSGTPEAGGFLHLTCMQVPVESVLRLAHSYQVSLTAFLSAAMMMALQNLQAEKIPDPRQRPSVKVLIPVNLRKLFPSKTLRNFALYSTPEIQPKLGRYEFDEICKIVKHTMGVEITPKIMATKIATNVSSERSMAIRLIPLPIKNIVMKAVFDAVGEKKSSLSLSNLGNVELPEAMRQYVQRMDFILGVQAMHPSNCGVLSYNGTVYINFIRDIRESELEMHFFRVLRDFGLPVTAESNQKEDGNVLHTMRRETGAV